MMLRGVLVTIGILALSAIAGAEVTVSVNGASPIRTITETMFGGNLTAWDGAQSGGNTTFNALLKASGRTQMRWPGGSWGDAFLWSDMRGPNNANNWIVTYGQTLNLLNLIRHPGEIATPSLQPIVNFPGYWYDTAQGHAAAVAAAVAWVRDQSGRTPTATYWEIGNEIGGPWEAGWFEGISGTYYGDKFADFYLAMKAVNPTIRIGACAEPYHGLQPWGWYEGYWTFDTLTSAFAKGTVPDYLIIHQYPGGDPASDNPALLGARVNDIGVFTASLDSIVAHALGSAYVGKIGYAMTEWDCGEGSGYARRRAYVNAMFHAQYLLEMAKHKWELANAWAQWEYGSAFSVYPVWYIHPLLIHRFGREMVTASSSNSPLVRAYAAKDAAGDLTLFVVNNSPTVNETATVNVSGFTAGTAGERWVIAPAGSMVTGGVNNQDLDKISINGIVHPDPLTVGSIAGQPISVGNSFTVSLPASGMMIVKIPLDTTGGPDVTPPTPNPMRWAARPTATGADSIRMAASAAADVSAVEYYFACTFGGGHDSGWQSSPVYEDTGLTGGQTYTYSVKARDLSVGRNETLTSVPASAIPFNPAGAIDNDGYYVMGSGGLSGFNGAAAGTARLHFNGLNGTISGISGASNSWWIAFGPTDRTKMPYSLTGTKGWKLPFTNTSAGVLQLYLVVSTAANNWQQGPACRLNAGQSGTAYVDIAGPGTLNNFWIVVSVSRDYDVLTFTANGVAETAKPWRYGDFDGNHRVEAADMAGFSALWLFEDCRSLVEFDLNGDCVIGLNEFAEMAGNWLRLN